MTILYHDVHRADPAVEAELGATFVPLEELLPPVRLRLAPRQPDRTRRAHLINAETLAWMKPTAVLVNTSRGPVVDQRALADALPTAGSSPRRRST